MSGETVASIVAILAALILAWRGLRVREMGAGKFWKIALVWIGIIMGMVAIIRLLGLEVAP